MIKAVFISETNCITPLGFDVKANVENIINGVSGIKLCQGDALMGEAYCASVINDERLKSAFEEVLPLRTYTRLEQMLILALRPIVKQSGLTLDDRTAFMLSTTKGNITALENLPEEGVKKAELYTLAKVVSDFFGFKTSPIVISNACVSGILAVSVAKRLIQSGLYDNVFIVAGDEVSAFVLAGFNSFQAMSKMPCRPYSKDRDGVSLGEAAAAVLVTSDKAHARVRVLGDSSINDANHISGPSRTGEGLFRSINNALAEAEVKAARIDYISAHGTATPYNDEMEAIAFNRAGLQHVPVNSLKGFYGHTLGASGLLETVIGIASMRNNKLFPSLGCGELGVSQPINVIEKATDKNMRYFLKTASGFGGCNSAVVFEKVN